MRKSVKGKMIETIIKTMMVEDQQLYKQKEEVSGVDEKNDILYDMDFAMDYYVPANCDKKYDIYVVDIHGGAWVYGEKKLNRHFCMHLSAYGFPVFNIDYGLTPTYTACNQIQQIYRCLHYINNHAKEFGVEHARLCLAGDSAGAHLASLAACISEDKALQLMYGVDGNGIQVDALLLQHGYYDMEHMKISDKPYMKVLYGWLFPKKDRRLHGHNSILAFLNDKWNIPIFVLSSAKDEMFSPQSVALVKKLQEMGIVHDSLIWDKTYELGHVFHLLAPDMSESEESVKRMVSFLQNICASYDDKCAH